MSDAISWYLDGRPIRFANWSADMVALGGYRDFQGICPGSEALRAEQESELQGYRRDGSPFWYGTLTLDPEITDGQGSVTAEGVFKQAFSTKTGRRFFMTRDEKLFKAQSAKPYNYPSASEPVEGQLYEQKIENGQLKWWGPKGEDVSVGDNIGFVCFIKDAILTHFTATLLSTGTNPGRQDYEPRTGFGPSGDTTIEPTGVAAADRISIGAASIDVALTQTSGDLFRLKIRRNSNAAIADKITGKVRDIELRGLATSSEFTLADCLSVLLQQDARTPDVAPSTLDVMPLDWVGTDYELCVYLVSVADWHFQLLYKDTAGIVGRAGPWEDVIQVARRRNARTPLQALRRYNRVRVPFTTTSDDEQQAVGVANPDPFPGKEVEFIVDSLEDKQRDGSEFPQDVADLLVARYSKPRRQGTITLSEARLRGKLLSPYEVQASYLADIIDHDPSLVPQRMDVVKWDGSGVVQVDVESESSAIRTLKAAQKRKPSSGKKGKR